MITAFVEKLFQLLIIAFCAGCSLYFTSCHRSEKIDPFYTNRGEWDDYELPLIKPYKIIQLKGMTNWAMNFEETIGMLDSITEVNVVGKSILVHSMKTYNDNKQREVWAVIIPSRKSEERFLTHKEYSGYLSQIGFNKEPQLYNIERVAHYAANNATIDWKKLNNNSTKFSQHEVKIFAYPACIISRLQSAC